ncbi:hypothetical protein DVDV_4257 [Desulfovibrio sp. DV]|nr:hypothetical protein DVDV_4257 [Desulfovibrio sp. DV]
MAGIEKHHRLAGLGLFGRLDGPFDGVGGFRRRQEAFRAQKQLGRFKTLGLIVGRGLHQPFIGQIAHDGRVAVVAQAAGVDRGGHEGVPQGVHFEQRRKPGHVAIVIAELPPGQGRAGLGFDGNEPDGFAGELSRQKGQHQTGKVAAAADATDQIVWPVPGHGQLLFHLKADDGLVVQNMVEHAAQGVLGVVMGGGVFHGLGDGQSKGPGAVGVFGQHGPAGPGVFRGRGKDLSAVGIDENAAIGLLVVAHLDHVDRAFHAHHGTGKGQGRAPLAGSGLGSQAFHALGLVVISLGDGGIGLVRPGRRDRLVFIINLAFDPKRLFQALGPHQRRRTIEAINVEHRLGDGQPAGGRHFLLDDGLGENDFELLGTDGLFGLGIERRGQGCGQVRQSVIPLRRHLALGQIDLHFHVSLRFPNDFIDPRLGKRATRQGRPRSQCHLSTDSLVCQLYCHR